MGDGDSDRETCLYQNTLGPPRAPRGLILTGAWRGNVVLSQCNHVQHHGKYDVMK